MSGCRTFWRRLATILQVVVLLATPLAAMGGDLRCEVAVGHVHLASLDSSGDVTGIGSQADRADGTRGDAGTAGGSDCCHAHSMRPAGHVAPAFTRTFDRKLAGVRAVTFDSVAPDRLAEPPRTFA